MPTATSQAAPLSAYAIQVDARDNVAVAKVAVPRGTLVQVGSTTVEVLDDVSPGHRFALMAIPEGDFVRQYGQPIGTSKGVAPGALI
jgi:altronate hydrolase